MKINNLSLKAETSAEPLSKEMSILDHIEKIIDITKKHGISKCLSKGKVHLNYVTEKLRITPIQAVIFSNFMERCNENYIRISEVAESLHCSMIKILKYMNECEVMEKLKLIRCIRNSDGTFYRIPMDVRDSLRKNDEYKPEVKDNLTITKLFSFMRRLFEERNNNEFTYEFFKADLLELINQNMHLDFCKKITGYNLNDDNIVLLLCFCHLSRNNNDDCIGAHDFEFMYDDFIDFCGVEDGLTSGSHILMENKLIEYSSNDGLASKDRWRLSDYAKKEFLFELKSNNQLGSDVIRHENIKNKKMFYNIKEMNEIQRLTSLLEEDNFKKILERLDEKGMRKGFACLFSGAPGTGKTETVYQIARETKRNIMMVDISSTKSMWYGGSEKKIKEIFDSYRFMAENSDTIPILLINEADAVIGKRKEIGSHNRSIDQTENAVQNIILQEMENLSGILIATSNLTQNMDSAFERRFLFKINFDKPSAESRKGIWNTMLSELSESDAGELSKRFELSGGQIENIARKIEIDSILEGNVLNMEKLNKFCNDEVNNKFNTEIKIGFGV